MEEEGRPDWLVANRASWDARTPIHVASQFYDVEGFVAGRKVLHDFEVEELGHVGLTGRRLLHLQCHFGLDTLTWGRLGAEVTGLDFSAPAVLAARDLAARIGVEARFVRSDLYDAASALAGEKFDIVYTGKGALNWLPDIDRWAEVVDTLLAQQGDALPGGVPPHPLGPR